MKYYLIILFSLVSLVVNAQKTTVRVALRNGASIEGVVKEFDPLDHITVLIGNIESKIPMSEVAYVDHPSKHEDNFTNEKVGEKVLVEVPDKLADYKGFLLSAGNNVFVYCTNSDAEFSSTLDDYTNAARNRLNRLLKSDGFWNVVDDMRDAHFVISYVVDTQGSDKAHFFISSWRSKGYLFFGGTDGNENADDNRANASKFYRKYIVPLQKKDC